jgi:hypothetical protein
MMRGKKVVKVLLVIFAFGAIYWFGLRIDPKVAALNQAIQEKGYELVTNGGHSFFALLKRCSGFAAATQAQTSQADTEQGQ